MPLQMKIPLDLEYYTEKLEALIARQFKLVSKMQFPV